MKTNISMTHEINDSENTVIGIRTFSGICKNKDKNVIIAVITKAAAKTARNTRKISAFPERIFSCSSLSD